MRSVVSAFCLSLRGSLSIPFLEFAPVLSKRTFNPCFKIVRDGSTIRRPLLRCFPSFILVIHVCKSQAKSLCQSNNATQPSPSDSANNHATFWVQPDHDLAAPDPSYYGDQLVFTGGCRCQVKFIAAYLRKMGDIHGDVPYLSPLRAMGTSYPMKHPTRTGGGPHLTIGNQGLKLY